MGLPLTKIEKRVALEALAFILENDIYEQDTNFVSLETPKDKAALRRIIKKIKGENDG